MLVALDCRTVGLLYQPPVTHANNQLYGSFLGGTLGARWAMAERGCWDVSKSWLSRQSDLAVLGKQPWG
jgi:hypothetical protein